MMSGPLVLDNMSRASAPASSRDAEPPSVQPGPSQTTYLCTYCQHPCKLEGSKAASTIDLTKRYETVCLTNKRNIERRVKSRLSTDALVIWWKNLLKNSEMLAQWLRKMKKKDAHSRVTDEEHFTMTTEKEVEGIEDRDRRRYYGFDTIVFNNPGKSEEELLEMWKLLAESAPSKIQREGQVT